MQIKERSKTCGTAMLIVAAVFIYAATVRMSAAATPLAPVHVSIDNFSFTPMNLSISTGTQVVWTNKDDVPHTIVSVDHQFKSKTLDTDEVFTFTFQNPGTYEYFCSVHPKMTGKIVVQ